MARRAAAAKPLCKLARRPMLRAMAATLYMDAVITPNRSLSKKGFYWLIGVLVAFNLVIAAFFLSIEAPCRCRSFSASTCWA